MAATHGKSGRIKKQLGAPIVFTNETMAFETASRTRLYIADRAKAYWSPANDVTVEVQYGGAGDWVGNDACAIEYSGGYVEFPGNLDNLLDLVRVSGACLTMAPWGGMLSWKLDKSVDVLDATNFESPDGYKEYVMGFSEYSGSADAYWQSAGNDAVLPLMAGNDPCLLFSLYPDKDADGRYDAYGRIEKTDVSVAPNSLVKERLSFKADKVYYRED